MIQEQNLIELCRRADDAPEPPVRELDLNGLVTAGRRRVRQRLALRTAVVMMSVAAIVGGSVTAVNAFAMRTAARGVPVAKAPVYCEWGEARWRFRLSWAPPELEVMEHSINKSDACFPLIEAFRAKGSAAKDAGLELHVEVAFDEDDVVHDVEQYGESIPRIRGGAAYRGDPGVNGPRIWWQVRPGVWGRAWLTGAEGTRYADRAVAETAMRQAAASVEEIEAPVRLPFRLRHRSPNYRLVSASEGTVRATGWLGEALLVNTEGQGRIRVRVQDGNHLPGKQTRTVDGHVARFRWEEASYPTLSVLRDGRTFQVIVSPKTAHAIGGEEGLVRIYRQIEMASQPAKPSTWFTWPGK